MKSRRAQLLDDGLKELCADALLVVGSSSGDPDLAAFVGPVHLGRSFVLRPVGQEELLGYLVDMEREEAAATGLDLLSPPAEELIELRLHGASESEIWSAVISAGLEQRSLAHGRLALAGHPPAGAVHSITHALCERGFEFEDGHELVRRLRKTKLSEEIEMIRTAAAGTCEAFRSVAQVLVRASVEESGGAGGLLFEGVPLTAGILRREILQALAERDLEQPEGNIVSCGAEAGVPHTRGGDDRQLRAGEAVVVDLFPRGRLFADCTRTFCVGEPTEDFRRAHEICLKALGQAAEASRPGVAGRDLQTGVCDLFEREGYPTTRSDPGSQSGYVHGLGHGVGYELHELPSFRGAKGADGVLEAGDVFTLEPGLYDPNAGWGVRLEDLYLMTSDGPEKLTPLPYDLDPRSW